MPYPLRNSDKLLHVRFRAFAFPDLKRSGRKRVVKGYSMRVFLKLRVVATGTCDLINLPLGEDQAMLDPHAVQHAVQVESGGLDLVADLFLGHSRGFVQEAEGMPFAKLDNHKTAALLHGLIHGPHDGFKWRRKKYKSVPT